MMKPTNLPWPSVEYRSKPDGDGQNPSSYTEWWDIPGVARFDSEVAAMFVHDMASNFDEIVSVLRDARETPHLADRADEILKSIRAVDA